MTAPVSVEYRLAAPPGPDGRSRLVPFDVFREDPDLWPGFLVSPPEAVLGAVVLETNEDSLVVGDHLSFLVERLCFRAVVSLVSSGACTIRHLDGPGTLTRLEVEGGLVRVTSGGRALGAPLRPLLEGLHGCGVRYLSDMRGLRRSPGSPRLLRLESAAREALERSR